MSPARDKDNGKSSEDSAALRESAKRRRALESLLEALEASEGLSLEEWRKRIASARRTNRKSQERRELREVFRSTKARAKTVCEILSREAGTFRAIAAGMNLLRAGPHVPVGCLRKRAPQYLSDSVLTIVRRCRLLCSACVDSSRSTTMLMVRKEAELASALAEAPSPGHSSSSAAERKLRNQRSGALKRPVLTIPQALETPRRGLDEVCKAAGYKDATRVREFTPSMQAVRWIQCSAQGVWSLTRDGKAVVEAES